MIHRNNLIAEDRPEFFRAFAARGGGDTIARATVCEYGADMADPSIAELNDRVRNLERDLEALRAQVAKSPPSSGSNWVESVSGSMKDFPEDSYRKMIEAGRAIVAGEIEIGSEM